MRERFLPSAVPPDRLPAIERAALAGHGEGWADATSIDARKTLAAAYRANARLRMGALKGPLVAQALDPTQRAASSRATDANDSVKSLTEVG